MPKLAKTTILPLVLAAALLAPGAAQALPRSFFGIAPQTALTDVDASYMKAGGIGSIRTPFAWAAIQPSAGGDYDWSSTDPVVEVAARARLKVLPFLCATPSWLAKATTLPVDNGREKRAWRGFVEAAVERYGPGGQFWREHRDLPQRPIRTWQIWNEANFFYFAFPVSPSRYARALKIAHGAVKAVDPGAKVLLSGLFGKPDEGGRKGMPAARFLAGPLPRAGGQEPTSTASPCTPTPSTSTISKTLVEGMREVVVRNRDRGTALYITEMGWGSQNDPSVVAFEQGIAGQARELRKAYRYLIANRGQPQPEGRLLVLVEGQPRIHRMQLLRLGRALPRRGRLQAEARLEGVRRDRSRTDAAVGRFPCRRSPWSYPPSTRRPGCRRCWRPCRTLPGPPRQAPASSCSRLCSSTTAAPMGPGGC